jgi:hypothetical protein
VPAASLQEPYPAPLPPLAPLQLRVICT